MMAAAGGDAYSVPGPSSAGEGAGLLARVGRVFSFDTTVYDEVAAAPATLQALIVIAVASTLSGSFFTIVLFFVMIPVGLAGVAVSALLTMTAARLFAGRPASVGEWYRALGFAQAPLVIGVIPFIGGFIAPFYAIAAAVAAISRVGHMSIVSAVMTFGLAILLPFLIVGGLLFLVVGADTLMMMGGGVR